MCSSDPKVFGEDFLTKPMERAQQDANLAFLNEVKLYIMENMDKGQNIKTSEAIQEIVWKKQTCKCESVYENLEPKRPTLWTFRGPAATRGGKSFG